MVKKIRHMIESSQASTVIYTDHGASLSIVKQTTLFITSTDKLNLQLVRASDYLQQFNLDIQHKSGKQHIVLDTLSRLASVNEGSLSHEGELDALHGYAYTTSLVEMSLEFKNSLIQEYAEDSAWKQILDLLDGNETLGTGDTAKLPFVQENGLIFHINDCTGDHAFQPRRLCISKSQIKEIFVISHTRDGHPGFARSFE